MFRTALILYVLTLNHLAMAAADPSQNYDLAQKALAQNDCKSAITYLQSYKAYNIDNLNKHPDFSKQIDRQISICMDQLKQDEGGKKIVAAVPSDKGVAATAAAKDAGQQNLMIKKEAAIFKNIQGNF